jgi:hypothetical protein
MCEGFEEVGVVGVVHVEIGCVAVAGLRFINFGRLWVRETPYCLPF